MILDGKVALVTGASSGIGKAIAEMLMEARVKIIGTYNRGRIDSKKIFPVHMDLKSEKSIVHGFQKIADQYHSIDILINSAGINTGGGIFDLRVWRDVFEVDLFGLVSVTEKGVKLMNNGGKIINISSVYSDGKASWKGVPAYAAAKAAVSNFTQTLAKNLAPKILVNAVAPGYVDTPIWGKYSAEVKEASKKESLIERFVTPEEVASVVIELARSDAMTGEIIVVDGGLSLKTI